VSTERLANINHTFSDSRNRTGGDIQQYAVKTEGPPWGQRLFIFGY
jgi:hypothetical protein